MSDEDLKLSQVDGNHNLTGVLQAEVARRKQLATARAHAANRDQFIRALKIATIELHNVAAWIEIMKRAREIAAAQTTERIEECEALES